VTRRKFAPPPADPDNYGFDIAGKGFRVSRAELVLLLGLDVLTCLLYFRCLKPFADRAGHVHNASYYRFLKLLEPIQSERGGRRLPTPTVDQLRRCVARLLQAGLITNYSAANRNAKALQIRLTNGVRGSSKL
jgi:hypothetical protein